MNTQNINKMVFSNVHDLLANLPEREKTNAISFLNKRDILGNKTLEDDVLFQYNAVLCIAMTYEKMQGIYQDFDTKLNGNSNALNSFLADFNNSVETQVNHATQTINNEIGKTVEATNTQVGRLNTTVINLVDNVSSYIDKSMYDLLEQVKDERTKNINEISAFVDLAKEQLKAELQGLIVSLVKDHLNAALKDAVKEPMGTHLKHYSGTANKIMTEKFTDMDKRVQKMESKINGGHDPWGLVRIVRDVVVFGGVLLVAKLFHFF
jgi:polyribonucleotide nucleotidyltransferase